MLRHSLSAAAVLPQVSGLGELARTANTAGWAGTMRNIPLNPCSFPVRDEKSIEIQRGNDLYAHDLQFATSFYAGKGVIRGSTAQVGARN